MANRLVAGWAHAAKWVSNIIEYLEKWLISPAATLSVLPCPSHLKPKVGTARQKGVGTFSVTSVLTFDILQQPWAKRTWERIYPEVRMPFTNSWIYRHLPLEQINSFLESWLLRKAFLIRGNGHCKAWQALGASDGSGWRKLTYLLTLLDVPEWV